MSVPDTGEAGAAESVVKGKVDSLASIEERRRMLRLFNYTVLAVLGLMLILLFVAILNRSEDGRRWGLLLFAMTGVACGAAFAIWLSALQREDTRFREAMTAISSAAGGTALFDLGNSKGVLRTAIQSAAVGCGMDPGDSLVVATTASFAGVSMLWLYVNRLAWINSLIVRGLEDTQAFDSKETKPVPATVATTSKKEDGKGLPKADEKAPDPGKGEEGARKADVFGFKADKKDPADVPPLVTKPDRYADDPLHAEYAGRERLEGFRIAARVSETDDPDWFEIYAIVLADLPGAQASGPVTFLMHPTFNPDRVEKMMSQGSASIRLRAWGAFTMGAIVKRADGTTVKLGIDLAELPDAPTRFKIR